MWQRKNHGGVTLYIDVNNYGSKGVPRKKSIEREDNQMMLDIKSEEK